MHPKWSLGGHGLLEGRQQCPLPPLGKDTVHTRLQRAFQSWPTPLPLRVGGERPVTFYVPLVNLDFMCNQIWGGKSRRGPFLLLMRNLNTAQKRCHS